MPATFPAGFASALARPLLTPELWLEIEGLPYAFGFVARPSSWFSSRAAGAGREGVLALLDQLPAGIEQTIRPIDGQCSIGRLTQTIVDDAAGHALDLVAHSGRTDGIVSLTANLAAGTADLVSLAYVGTATDAAFPPGGGVFYLGRETFSYAGKTQGTGSGTFNTVKRLRYRIEGQTETYAHTAGDLISPYPRFVRTRRAALYLSLDGTDAGKIVRSLGAVADVKAVSGLTGFSLDLDTIETFLKAQVFGGQIRGKLAKGIAAGDGSYSGNDGDPFDAGDPVAGIVVQLDAQTLQGRPWVEGQRVVFRVGDEYFAGRTRVGAGLDAQIHVLASSGEGRSCFNSAAESHSIGDELVEVLVLAGRQPAGVPEFAAPYSTFDHPLDLALALLTSRNGDGANGAWDVLPFGGIAFDAAFLDSASVADLRDRWLPGVRHLEVLEEPAAFLDWLATALRPLACYPAHRADGRFTIKRVNPPIPGATLRTLDATAITSVPSWASGTPDVYGRVYLRADYDPSNTASERSPFRTEFKVELNGPGLEAQEFYLLAFKTHEVDAKGQWTGLPSGPSVFGAGYNTGAEDLAYRLVDVLRARYARPWPLIGAEALVDQMDLEDGDLVMVNLDHVPDVTAGTRGLAGAICEILLRKPDEGRGIVSFTLQHTGYRLGSARYVAPSAMVSAGATSATVATTAHVFSAADAALGDAQHFPAGAKVRILSADLKTTRASGRTVQSSTATSVVLDAAVTVSTGDVVVLDDYATQPQAVKDLFAFLADTTPDFSNGDAAQLFAA